MSLITIERKIEQADVKLLKGRYQLTNSTDSFALGYGQPRGHATAFLSLGSIKLGPDADKQIGELLKRLNMAFINEEGK